MKGEQKMKFTKPGVRLLVVPLLAASLIFHPQPHAAHTLFTGMPVMVGWSAEAVSFTATASTTMLLTGTR